MKDSALTHLFRRYRDQRDGRALAAVFDATAKELLELACHLVRDPAEAEDLVQSTFLTAIAKAGRYDGSSPVQGWLYGILWREAAKARRRAARTLDPRRVGTRAEADPLEVAAGEEVPRAVEEALARLPQHYRDVLRPLLFEEKRPEHIARELARSPGTVRSQIHRGLEELRRSLAPGLAAHAAVVLPTRGLASVRASVLEAAGFPASTAATAPLVATALAAGATVASKTVLAGAAVAAVALTGTWFALEGSASHSREAQERASAGARASVAAAEAREADPTPATSTARAESVPDSGPDEAAPAAQRSVAYWLARFAEAPDDWRHGWDVAGEIAELPAAEALSVMQAVWPHLSVPVKEQVLKPFVFHGGHAHALEVLHLAATDAATSVQARAFIYLESYSFQDFALDYAAYLEWAARYRSLPVADVLLANARAFTSELLSLSGRSLDERMLALNDIDFAPGRAAGLDLAAEIRAAGGERILEAALASSHPEVVAKALSWSKKLGVDERWLRTWVLPAIEQGVPEIDAWFEALERPDCGWAVDPILAHLRRAAKAPLGGTMGASQALAAIGDPRAIPALIEILIADQTGELTYPVGHFGLAKLAGVRWQESYDAAWWLDWWEKNRARFPADVAALSVGR